jgi:hypothetical protein
MTVDGLRARFPDAATAAGAAAAAAAVAAGYESAWLMT